MNFQLDLLDNPFIDLEISLTIFGKPESLSAGFGAQFTTMTLIKDEKPLYPFGFGWD